MLVGRRARFVAIEHGAAIKARLKKAIPLGLRHGDGYQPTCIKFSSIMKAHFKAPSTFATATENSSGRHAASLALDKD